MKLTKILISIATGIFAVAGVNAADSVKNLISAKNVDVHFADSSLVVTADIVLDSR